jgi:hypothetical protein
LALRFVNIMPLTDVQKAASLPRTVVVNSDQIDVILRLHLLQHLILAIGVLERGLLTQTGLPNAHLRVRGRLYQHRVRNRPTASSDDVLRQSLALRVRVIQVA